jgi:N,N'-diacetyllegionaminate synthase
LREIVKIGNKKIGGKNPTYIIAEIGANHNRDIKTAKKLIDLAAEAGVDAVKFQTYKAETLYSKKAPKFSKDKLRPFDLIKSVELPYDWHKEIFDYTKKKNLHFLSSPFDYEAVDLLDRLGILAFKIASFEITDLELLKYTAKKKKPIILSTGMATFEEINDALKTIRSQRNDNIILLHCNSLYPTPSEIVNLNAISRMHHRYKIPIGFSDHTLGIHISIAAIIKGAKVIEKHFTLDRNMKGPDHHFALEPNELKQMVRNIRDVEKAEGTGEKKVTKQEKEMYEKGRRSIIAAVDIKKGTKIKPDMLTIKRPGYGIKPKFLHKIIGNIAKNNIKADQWITWDDLY